MMSSRGVTRAQLEARRREMERQREEQRRKEVWRTSRQSLPKFDASMVIL